MYVCMYICLYVCTHVCMYVHVCMHIHNYVCMYITHYEVSADSLRQFSCDGVGGRQGGVAMTMPSTATLVVLQ